MNERMLESEQEHAEVMDRALDYMLAQGYDADGISVIPFVNAEEAPFTLEHVYMVCVEHRVFGFIVSTVWDNDAVEHVFYDAQRTNRTI
jgi:hypothetical protein